MTAKALRDLPRLPLLAEVLAPYFAHWARLREILASGWNAQDRDDRLVRAAIGHAIDFQTWRSLTREGSLADPAAVALMVTLARCLARGRQDDGRAGPTSARRTRPSARPVARRTSAAGRGAGRHLLSRIGGRHAPTGCAPLRAGWRPSPSS